MKFLLTGASGFIGGAVLKAMRTLDDVCVYPVFRSTSSASNLSVTATVSPLFVPELASDTEWGSLLADIDVVIHAAARAHFLDERAYDSLIEYREVNVGGTLSLARQAAAAGVKRFVFISTIGVNGGQTIQPFMPEDVPKPATAYARSKYEAEIGLQKISAMTNMEVVIIRPPLVYGRGAPGNFGRLMELVERRWPLLPFGSIKNKRSLVSLDNLVDFIFTCSVHPFAADHVFLVSDDCDVSTTQLLTTMNKFAGGGHLLPVPLWVLRFLASILGKQDIIDKISCNLQVDIQLAKQVLGWKPKLSFEEGIRRCFNADDDSGGDG
ncbi:MAG: NAD-dependent epimerase/dehydratase family protein [Pseudomonas sp.]|nr:MAG: NAD-dependent epimerase/dehydratase family protein [Pseudomonas sp.]